MSKEPLKSLQLALVHDLLYTSLGSSIPSWTPRFPKLLSHSWWEVEDEVAWISVDSLFHINDSLLMLHEYARCRLMPDYNNHEMISIVHCIFLFFTLLISLINIKISLPEYQREKIEHEDILCLVHSKNNYPFKVNEGFITGISRIKNIKRIMNN